MGDMAVLIGVGGYVFFSRYFVFGFVHSDGEDGQRQEVGRCGGSRPIPRAFRSVDGFRNRSWDQPSMVGTLRGPPNVRAVPRFLCAPSVLRLNQVWYSQGTCDLYGE